MRGELLESTEGVVKLRDHVGRRRRKPLTAAGIGVRAGRVINRYKVAKHFRLDIADNHFGWERDTESIAREAALDGIYVVRTSETPESLSAEDAVRAYKSLGDVEQAFRTFKGVDLLIRPIYHRLEDRVRRTASMLAYYGNAHAPGPPPLYADEELEAARQPRSRRQGAALGKPQAQARPETHAGRTAAPALGRAAWRAIDTGAQHMLFRRRQNRRALYPRHDAERLPGQSLPTARG